MSYSRDPHHTQTGDAPLSQASESEDVGSEISSLSGLSSLPPLRSLADIRWTELPLTLVKLLESALAGRRLNVDEATFLFETATEGEAWVALTAVADARRQALVGDAITYVINRNLNFTNVCVYDCKFCSFAESIRSEAAQNSSLETLLQKSKEALELNATELCIQGGINPKLGDSIYLDILKTLHTAYPSLHLHAYSPFEIDYAAKRLKRSHRDYLMELQENGLGSLPGTAAEILDDDIREVIAPGKIDTATWIAVIETAHRLNIPTSATIMFGHIDTARHRAAHLETLRQLQERTGGFTEFVPLPFVHNTTPLYRDGTVVTPLRLIDKLAIYPIARLFFQELMPNIQVSWPKLGYKACLYALRAGANDFGGTLMEESITKAAGGTFGDYTSRETFERLIAHINRPAKERTTTYERVSPQTHLNQHRFTGLSNAV